MDKRIAVVLVAAVAACSSFGSSGGGESNAQDAGDAVSPEAGAEAAAGGDASSDAGPRGRVACNTGQASSCAVGSEVCCVQWGAQLDQCIPAPVPVSLAMSCPAESSDAGDTRVVACDDSSECGTGKVCCADLTILSRLNSACVPAGNCNQPNYEVLCNTRGLSCADGRSCVQIQGYNRYSYCQ